MILLLQNIIYRLTDWRNRPQVLKVNVSKVNREYRL